jgi:integrase
LKEGVQSSASERALRLPYSCSLSEITAFVDANKCVQHFLNQYEKGGVTYFEKSVGLAKFFRWLKIVKGLDLLPNEFLNMVLQKRSAKTVENRQWAVSLVLEFSRDNPDLKECGMQYRYSAFFLPVKLFCDSNEVTLTSKNGFFQKRSRRKYQQKPYTAEIVKKILGCLNQRGRAICMTQLQSGQGIKQVLVDISMMGEYVFREIDAGKKRIRVDFPERKGNGFAYFSFLGNDAIDEIQKWRVIRDEWLESLGKKSPYLFIERDGGIFERKYFHNEFRLAMIKHGIQAGPYSIPRHGFRKFFEQEASPPERGISKSYVSFMMGHSNGTGQDHKLDVVGGVYDHAPEVYPGVVEKEYAKLESYLNIYTGRTEGNVSNEDREVLELLKTPGFKEWLLTKADEARTEVHSL